MRLKVITLTIVVLILVGLSSLGRSSSSGQQRFPDSNRKIACGCYCGGPTPGYFVFIENNCAGILAADACGDYVSSLPPETRKQICANFKAKGKPSASCPLAKALADSCGEQPPDENCDKPAPWFDTSSSSGCKDVQDTRITIDQRTATATVSMCGYTVLKQASDSFGAKTDPLFRDAYTTAFKQGIPKKVCCDKFREAARTGTPCDPRTDLDCDGTPNQTDLNKGSSFPTIDIFTRAKDANIDPFPFSFNFYDPDFLPNSTARDSKGVGDCPCKWELIKGELKCNFATDDAGKKQHVYIATWRCPTTKAEVFTTKYAPSSAPCP